MKIEKTAKGINLVLSEEEQKISLASKIRKNPQLFIESLTEVQQYLASRDKEFKPKALR